MKRLIASAGLVALGAASVQAAYAPGLSRMETSKPWSVAATLRGFYDDNYTTAPSSAEEDSFGVEVRPSVNLNLPLEQTYLGFRAIYSMRWYEDRPRGEADHTFQFDGLLNHAFSERYHLDLNDSFIYAQEPDLVDPSGGTVNRLRTKNNNIRNLAAINFNAQLTQLLSIALGYANTYYDYEQDADDTGNNTAVTGGPGPVSRSGLLDRVEHLASVNLLWQALPSTVARLGYQFQIVDYTEDEVLNPPPVAPGGPPAGSITSGDRNSYAHYLFVGADHSFRSDLSGSIRIGGRYTEYPDAPQGDDQVSPYADASLTYAFARGSSVTAGIKHDRNQTDVGFAPGDSGVTVDQESTTLYANLQHQITPKLLGSLNGYYQNSKFNGGAADGDTDNLFGLGVNLTYQINQYLSAETGYNFDRIDSDISNRSYTRNRVYIGVTARY
jgi:hypothetical protein